MVGAGPLQFSVHAAIWARGQVLVTVRYVRLCLAFIYALALFLLLWPLVPGFLPIHSPAFGILGFRGKTAQNLIRCCGRTADACWSFYSFTVGGLQGFDYQCEALLRYMHARPLHKYTVFPSLLSGRGFLRTFWQGQKKGMLSIFQEGRCVCLRFGGCRSLPYAPAKA